MARKWLGRCDNICGLEFYFPAGKVSMSESPLIGWRMDEEGNFLRGVIERNRGTIDALKIDDPNDWRMRDLEECENFFTFFDQFADRPLEEIEEVLIEAGIDLNELPEENRDLHLTQLLLDFWPDFADERGLDMEDMNRIAGVNWEQGYVYFSPENSLGGQMVVAVINQL